jgi:hypothetical protein
MAFLSYFRYINSIAYGLNISRQKSTDLTPFFLMFLRKPQGIEILNAREGDVGEMNIPDLSDFNAQELIDRCAAVEKTARENIAKAQEKQCKEYQKRADKGMKVFSLHVGDSVLKLNSKKKGRKGDTLTKDWLGPYTLLQIGPKRQCLLQDLSGSVLKQKVNIAQLKPFNSVQTTGFADATNEKPRDTDSQGEMNEQQNQSMSLGDLSASSQHNMPSAPQRDAPSAIISYYSTHDGN